MGGQAYLARLALGRSAFEPLDKPPEKTTSPPTPNDGDNPIDAGSEPVGSEGTNVFSDGDMRWSQSEPGQVYDERGYPTNDASRAWARRMRHAQNDIIADVGLCARLDADAGDDKKRNIVQSAEGIEEELENGTGLFLTSSFKMVDGLCLNWIMNLGLRFLVYPIPPDLEMSEIIREDYKSLGPAAFFFSGFVTSFILDRGCLYWSSAAEKLIWVLTRLVQASVKSKRTRDKLEARLNRICKVLSGVGPAVLSPIWIYSVLQRIRMISPLPHFAVFLSHSAMRYLPSRGQMFQEPSLLDFFSLCWNRVTYERRTLIFVALIAFIKLENVLARHISRATKLLFPSPGSVNLRILSGELDAYAAYQAELRGEEPPPPQRVSPSVRQWAQEIFNHIIVNAYQFRLRLMQHLPMMKKDQSLVSAVLNSEAFQIAARPSYLEQEAARRRALYSMSARRSRGHGSSGFRDLQPPQDRVEETDEESVASTMLHAAEATTVDEFGDVEMRDPPPPPPERKPLHRVTVLSQFPSDDIQRLLVGLVTNVICLPARIAILRALAMDFGSMGTVYHPDPAVGRTNSWVSPPWSDDWFVLASGRLFTPVLVQRVGLCYAMAVTMRMSTWCLKYGVTRFIGKRAFNWGNL